jgi:hypothetical protein
MHDSTPFCTLWLRQSALEVECAKDLQCGDDMRIWHPQLCFMGTEHTQCPLAAHISRSLSVVCVSMMFRCSCAAILAHLLSTDNSFYPFALFILIHMQAPTHRAVLSRMLEAGRRWALSVSIKVDQGIIPVDESLLQEKLLGFMQQLGNAGVPVFVLLDEVQRFFATRYVDGVDAYQPPHAFFKDLVSPSPPTGGAPPSEVYVAMTGSSMCEAWLGFAKAPPNGHTMRQTRDLLSIPVNEDRLVQQVTIKHLTRSVL